MAPRPTWLPAPHGSPIFSSVPTKTVGIPQVGALHGHPPPWRWHCTSHSADSAESGRPAVLATAGERREQGGHRGWAAGCGRATAGIFLADLDRFLCDVKVNSNGGKKWGNCWPKTGDLDKTGGFLRGMGQNSFHKIHLNGRTSLQICNSYSGVNMERLGS